MPPVCKQKQGGNSAISAGGAFAIDSLENASGLCGLGSSCAGLNHMFANQQLIVLIRQNVVEGWYGLFNCFDCVLASLLEVCEMMLYNENSYPKCWV